VRLCFIMLFCVVLCSVLDPDPDPVGSVIIWLHGPGSVIGWLPGSGSEIINFGS